MGVPAQKLFMVGHIVKKKTPQSPVLREDLLNQSLGQSFQVLLCSAVDPPSTGSVSTGKDTDCRNLFYIRNLSILDFGICWRPGTNPLSIQRVNCMQLTPSRGRPGHWNPQNISSGITGVVGTLGEELLF